jgi:hypothetical protein
MQQHNNLQIADSCMGLHDLHEIQGIPVDICASVGCVKSVKETRLYLPGCDMLHKPCAHSNKHNNRQMAEDSSIRPA